MSELPELSRSRRRFLKQAAVASLASLSFSGRLASALSSAKEQAVPGGVAVKNRAPLAQNKFNLLPLGCVRPTGWLRDQLQIQASGLGGHLDETWADVGSNSGWLGGTGESWERGPYFLDGLVPLAYLLDDPKLKAKVQKWIDWTLTSQTPDGMFGPKTNDDWWPRMVMLKVLAQYQEATGDPRVIPMLSRYFAYQIATLPKRPLRDWGKFRWQDNVLIVIWLYNRTGDPKLLDLAKLLHQQGYDWQGEFANFKYTERITPEMIKLNDGGGLKDYALATHGVNNGQALKVSPVWSILSNSEEDRNALKVQLAALDKYHGLPNGMFSCDEHFAGSNPSQGTELCTVVEAMFSLELAMAILGDAGVGDRVELMAYNALPGTFTDDMWAHQYNQQPNQVECGLNHKPWTTDGPESGLFGLEPNFGCCAANFHQGWPKFTSSLWMESSDEGLVAALYAPCEVNTIIGKTKVRVQEETNYPFRDAVRITVSPETAVSFPLRLRIPAWAAGAQIRVNGTRQPDSSTGGFARIERTWKRGDVVELTLPMKPRLIYGFNDSVSVARGPLVFSYAIAETWVKLRDRGMTADWQVFPASQWNYALGVKKDGADAIAVEEFPVGPSPFALKNSPVKLKVSARKLPSWQAVDGVADPVPKSPVTSEQPQEQITLVPYAAAKLRVTAFPWFKDVEG